MLLDASVSPKIVFCELRIIAWAFNIFVCVFLKMCAWLVVYGVHWLSTIFQLYRGSQFYCWRKPEYQRKPPTCILFYYANMAHLLKYHFIFQLIVQNQMRQFTPHITGTVPGWSISRDHDHDNHCKLYGVQVKTVV